MSMTRWNPRRDLMSLREALDNLFEESFVPWARTEQGRSLAIDVVEKDDALVVRADLPGLNPEDIDIHITDNVLTIRGEYKHEEDKEEENYRIRERSYGRFERAIRLPQQINTDETNAEYENGVLHLTLPKHEEVKPKHIEVKAHKK